MPPRRRTPHSWNRQTIFKVAAFALPFVVFVVALGLMQAGFFDKKGEPYTPYSLNHSRDGSATAAAKTAPASQQNHPHYPVVPSRKLTRPLQVLPQSHRFPLLPEGIKAKGPVGTQLLLTVDETGAVVDATVEISSGANQLDQQAIDWVKANWRYRPAMAGNKPVFATTSALVFFTPQKTRH